MPLHRLPHDPQLRGSLDTNTHVPPQLREPPVHITGIAPQTPSVQTIPVGHMMRHPPQC